LKVPIGINTLIHTSWAGLDAVLNSINVYELWMVCLMAIAVRQMFKTSWGAAAAVTGVYWSLTTAVAAALAVLGQAFRPAA
jgi:hypothetical protein